jgi:AbrB family looped-hinge helix DNA binding protein
MTATITSKGQVTIPAAVRHRLGLKKGDQLEFRDEKGVVVLCKARPVGNPFHKQIGILPLMVGKTPVEITRDLRGWDEWDRENLA